VTFETLFTSESVTEGHPDKVADQISDAVLDAVMASDPYGRVACETFVNTGQVSIGGEITAKTPPDIATIARKTLVEIGYCDHRSSFDGNTCGINVSIDEQSADIAQGVDDAYETREEDGTDPLDKIGAGDQGMMFGYACDETPELMPLPIHLAHRMSERLAQVRHEGVLPYLLPDGKTQVTVAYADGKPQAIRTVVLSTHHDADVDLDRLRPDIEEHVIRPLLPEHLDSDGLRMLVNPTGRFEIGGPLADAGLTGRKIIVDTYGGMARHGGGAFSGKDCTKVDRSAAYAARWVAKNVVAAGLASKAELQLAYAIGVARPVSMSIETFGTENVDPELIYKGVDEVFDLRPGAFIRDLELRRPIYRPTAAYGHFGREGFTWERTDRADDLRSFVGA
jgi:S-adenosylmethionine synthetase